MRAVPEMVRVDQVTDQAEVLEAATLAQEISELDEIPHSASRFERTDILLGSASPDLCGCQRHSGHHRDTYS